MVDHPHTTLLIRFKPSDLIYCISATSPHIGCFRPTHTTTTLVCPAHSPAALRPFCCYIFWSQPIIAGAGFCPQEILVSCALWWMCTVPWTCILATGSGSGHWSVMLFPFGWVLVFLNPWCPRWGAAQLCADARAFRTLLSFTSELGLCPARTGPVRGVLDFCLSSLPCLSACPRHTAITYNNSRGAPVILRVSGAPCGPILMSHMWPVKKDPSDLPIRLITTQYILMSRVRSYTYNIHIHSTHAGIYMCINDGDINSLLVIFFSFILLFCSIMTNFCAAVYFSAQMLRYETWQPLSGMLYCMM